jgi:hypothetical protein
VTFLVLHVENTDYSVCHPNLTFEIPENNCNGLDSNDEPTPTYFSFACGHSVWVERPYLKCQSMQVGEFITSKKCVIISNKCVV